MIRRIVDIHFLYLRKCLLEKALDKFFPHSPEVHLNLSILPFLSISLPPLISHTLSLSQSHSLSPSLVSTPRKKVRDGDYLVVRSTYTYIINDYYHSVTLPQRGNTESPVSLSYLLPAPMATSEFSCRKIFRCHLFVRVSYYC